MAGPALRTDRLLLRRWRTEDLEPFAALNADAEVTRHLSGPLDRARSDAMAHRIELAFDADGFGLWALEVQETGEFIGFTGLVRQDFPAHFTPCVEVGWRLARHAWGHGYATEAARAALAHGFVTHGLDEIVSMTRYANVRSQAVMRRLGMHTDPADDFHHPGADGAGAPDSLLYRLTGAEWARATRPEIRTGTESDLAAVHAFGQADIREHYTPLIGEAAAEAQVRTWWSEDALRGPLRDSRIVLADADGAVVGVGQRGEWDGAPVIRKLYVHPLYRGHGAGPRLLEALTAQLGAVPPRLLIEHFAGNTDAGRFYDREGFTVDRIEPHRSGDPRLATVWRARTR